MMMMMILGFLLIATVCGKLNFISLSTLDTYL